MKNIVIYGGGFDPVHNGHINMAKNASTELDAEVFFVPARISVWKQKSSVSDADKLEMIKLAIKDSGCDRLSVSDYELNKETEINYSIDTVRYFKQTYKDANLYLLIGTDQANNFHKWKDCDEIAQLARIVLFKRPGYEVEETNIKRFNILILDGEIVDADSTDVRECRSLNTTISVINYIIDHELYFVKKIKSYISEKRYNHSVSVARLAYDIALSNKKKDPDRYFLAGILHDIGKYVENDEQNKIMNDFYPAYVNFPKPIIHQFIGAYLAKKDFDIKDEEVLRAIEFHTTGNSGMSDLEKTIYASDKIEPTRGFDSSDLIAIMKVSITDGFLTVLSANREYFIERNISYDNFLTKTCMDYYLK